MTAPLVPTLLMLALLAGCGTLGVGTPVYTPSSEVSKISTTFSAADVRAAIFDACKERGWTARENAPGLIVARLDVRGGKHIVVVNIPYNADTYSIRYQSSENMNEQHTDDGKLLLHPNYNKWVALLEHNIDNRLDALRKSRM